MASATSDTHDLASIAEAAVPAPTSDWNRTVDLLNFIFSPMDGKTATARPFGRFGLRRVLGRGGFGKVYLVDDPENPGRFALKIANETTLESPTRIERFLAEGERLVGLDHPNLATMHEFGLIDGIGFLRSHFCDGPNLRAWLSARDTLPDPVCAAEWTAQLADAVEYCHSRGIVHRDLKPSNVLFETQLADADNNSPNRWRLRIADFGLAHFLEDSDRTQSGDIVGTPGYLSPEQAEGKKAIGPATDVWGLGTILYELLTGTPAFAGRNDLERLRRLLEAAPIPPRQWNPQVPVDLEAICLRCLELDPRLRYGSAAALRDDLRRFVEGKRVRARRRTILGRVRRWATRRPRRAMAFAFAIVGLSALIATYAVQRNKVERALQIAQQEGIERQLQSQRLRKSEFFSKLQSAYRKLLAGQPNAAFELLGDADGFTDSFEYRHLKWLATGCGRAIELPGHHGRVYSVAFAPDGKFFATANADGTAAIWDVGGPTQRALLEGHTDEVNSIAISPDGKRVATVGDDGFTMVWNPTTGKTIATTKPFGGEKANECLFLDDNRLLVLSRDHRLKCLTTDSLKEIWCIVRSSGQSPDEKRWTTAMALSSDGKYAAVADIDAVFIYDLATQRQIATARASEPREWFGPKGYHKLGFIDGGDRLLAAADSLHVFDRATGTDLSAIPFQKATPTTFGASKDGRKLVVGRYSGSVEIWDLPGRRRLDLLSFHNDRIWDLAISPDGNAAVTGGNDSKAVLWDLRANMADGAVLVADGIAGHVRLACDHSRSDTTLVAVSVSGEIGQFDVRDWRRVGTATLDLTEKYTADSEPVLSRDGKFYAVVGKSQVSVFETIGGRRMWQLPIRGFGTTLAFSGDGRKLFIQDAAGFTAEELANIPVQSFDTTTGKLSGGGTVFTYPVRFAASTSGEILVGAWNDSISTCAAAGAVWNIPTLEWRHRPEPVLSPDESKVVGVRAFPNVRVFDVNSKECIAELKGNDSSVELAAFSHDGMLLATSEREGGAVQLWDLERQAKSLLLETGLKSVEQLIFAPDGSALIAAGQNLQGTRRIVAWVAPNGQH